MSACTRVWLLLVGLQLFRAGGGVLVINLMGECVYCEIFIWKVNMLPTSSFCKIENTGLIEIDVNHLVSQYFSFSLKILNFKYSLEIVRD